MTHYLLPEDIGRAFAIYFSQRPHGEVRRLVDALEALQPAPELVEPVAEPASEQ